MKCFFLLCILLAVMPEGVRSQIVDPVADFKIGLTIPPNDKVLKWECDLNGDGKKEILLSLKTDYDEAANMQDVPGWDLYIADAVGTYQTGNGIEEDSEIIHILPQINLKLCFIGQISELGKRGVITMRIDSPKEGDSIGIIYAYTIEGDHLKRTNLGQYFIGKGPHPLFAKYFTDSKRTQVQLRELPP